MSDFLLGERRFNVMDEGVKYQLSDGTELNFMSRGNVDGITNEELLGVLIHRLKFQSRQFPGKETSRCITKLEEAEETLWRRDIERRRNKRAAEKTPENGFRAAHTV